MFYNLKMHIEEWRVYAFIFVDGLKYSWQMCKDYREEYRRQVLDSEPAR